MEQGWAGTSPLPAHWPKYHSLSTPFELEVPINWAAIDRRDKDLGGEDFTFWNTHNVLRQHDEVGTLPGCN